MSEGLDGLSLQRRFLVAPAVGFGLMLLLAIAALVALREQSTLLLEEDRGRLAISRELIETFADLSRNHSLVYELLLGRNALDQEGIYEEGKPLIHDVLALEERLLTSGLKEKLDPDELRQYARLADAIHAYRPFLISAIEMATLDPDLANRHMGEATSRFLEVERRFVALLDVTRATSVRRFVDIERGAGRRFEWMSGGVVLAMACLVPLTIRLSRRLSADLVSLIAAMKRLADGEGDVEIPTRAASRETAAMAGALSVFREKLDALHAATVEAERVNGELEQEICEREKAERDLVIARDVFEHSLDGIMVTDADARILSVNPAFSEITGYSEKEAVGRTPRLLRSDHHDPPFYEALWRDLEVNGLWQGEIWNRRKDGTIYPEWRNISSVRDADGNVLRYISIFTDITHRKIAEKDEGAAAPTAASEAAARREPLLEKVAAAIATARRYQKKAALLCFEVTQRVGSPPRLEPCPGDVFREEARRRITDSLGAAGVVVTLEDDALGAIVGEVGSAAEVARLAEKCIEAFGPPCLASGRRVQLAIDVGVSFFPDDGDRPTSLVAHARSAAGRARLKGSGSYVFHAHDLHQEATAQIAREAELRKAFESGELEVYYQPRISGRSGEIVAAEALIRWNRPGRESIPPDEFTPLAEEVELMGHIGAWVMETALRQYADWQRLRIAPPVISMNLTRGQFVDPGLVGGLAQKMHDAQMPSGHVEIELAESTLMGDPEQSVDRLHKLRALGCRISIDDFGAANSSLSQLRRYPVDSLKIDPSLVRDLPVRRDDAAIVRAVISMARNLDISVVAEGVETSAQKDFLLESGCDEMQGHLLGKAMAAHEFSALLREQKFS